MDRYKFNGMAGQKIRIDMNATAPQPNGLDTYLYLYGPDGLLVDENDDIVLGSQTDSRIPCPNDGCGPNFRTLTQTGTYIIIATSFGSGDTGGYTLTLTSEPLLLTAQVTDSRTLPWYLVALLVSQPLHFGDYGGLPMKVIWALLDLITIVVLGSGLYLWWAKRRAPVPSEGRPVADAEPLPARLPLA